MEIKDFIGKVVVCAESQRRFVLHEITAPEITVMTVKPNKLGYNSYYNYRTVNGDPISSGVLVFEDKSLKEPFLEAYNSYLHTKDAYWENYGYWLRRD